jgi:hypothetical protein
VEQQTVESARDVIDVLEDFLAGAGDPSVPDPDEVPHKGVTVEAGRTSVRFALLRFGDDFVGRSGFVALDFRGGVDACTAFFAKAPDDPRQGGQVNAIDEAPEESGEDDMVR